MQNYSRHRIEQDSGFSVPPDDEKSSSVTAPKLNVSSVLVVVLRVRSSVPTVVAPDFAVIATMRPSFHAAAKSLSSVNGVAEVILAGLPPALNPTFGELVRAVP